MSTPGTYAVDRAERERFPWRSYPKAQRYLEQHLSHFLIPVREKRALNRPLRETLLLSQEATVGGLRFFDLIDTLRLALPSSGKTLLTQQGFVPQDALQWKEKYYQHRQAFFPLLWIEEVRSEKASGVLELVVKAEDLEKLKRIRGYSESIVGDPGSPLRTLSLADSQRGYTLSFVERKGREDAEKGRPKLEDPEKLKAVRDLFGKGRNKEIRPLKDPEEGFRKTLECVEKAIRLVGRERTAYEWVQAEVSYWESGNRAGTIQGDLQRKLGLGWVNKDHITYRNSKRFFPRTVEILSRLGFEKRENLHAEEFTAQVMEHPFLGVAAFVDVDPPEKSMGTVGLWVRLHGESMLAAGLHHMAARFSFLKIQGVLKEHGISFRPPFSFYDDLRQAFTEGEKHPVSESSAKELLREGLVSTSQYRDYLKEGALYTHLENIQRGNGFKGFNPKAVDKTIRDTGKDLHLKTLLL